MSFFNRVRKETTPRPRALLGPTVPPDFEDNGCGVLGTRLLDFGGIFAWCGRIHDYEYALARQIKDPVARDKARYVADRNFKANIRTMTRRGGAWYKRAFGWVIARAYFWSVRSGGWWVVKRESKRKPQNA